MKVTHVERAIFLLLLGVELALAQDPWSSTSGNIRTNLLGPIAKNCVAIATGACGLGYCFSQNQTAKIGLGSVAIGGATALGADRMMTWWFG